MIIFLTILLIVWIILVIVKGVTELLLLKNVNELKEVRKELNKSRNKIKALRERRKQLINQYLNQEQ